MLAYDDCVALCRLAAEEIAAIARHEHLPEIVALELASYLAATRDGRRAIEAMIRNDVAAARNRGPAIGRRLESP